MDIGASISSILKKKEKVLPPLRSTSIYNSAKNFLSVIKSLGTESC